MLSRNSNRLPKGKQYPSKPKIDLTGHRYGNLTVIHFIVRVERHYYWQCICECGTPAVVKANHLRTGKTISCGCASSHGMCNSGAYKSWASARRRTLCLSASDYERYGGVGITMCDGWNCFQNFFIDMGERPINHSIDRIKGSGNYSCGKCDECKKNGWEFNCKWSTAKEQAENRKSNHA